MIHSDHGADRIRATEAMEYPAGIPRISRVSARETSPPWPISRFRRRAFRSRDGDSTSTIPPKCAAPGSSRSPYRRQQRVFFNERKSPSSEMHLTASNVLSGLPAEWQAKMAENELIPVTSGMSGAYVFRIPDRQAGDQYLKVGIGTNADQLRREGAR